MKNLVVIGGLSDSLINFRGALLRTLSVNGHNVYACAPSASQSTRDDLAALGVRYVDIPLSRTGLNPFRDIISIFSLYRIMRNIKPDIVIGYTIKPVIYGSLAAKIAGVHSIFSIITGVGYVFTANGRKPGIIRLLSSFLYRMALAFNTKVFFQNPDDLALFKELGILYHTQKTALINGSGIDVAHFKQERLPKKMSFLLIARLLRDKGVLEYAEAAKVLREKYPETTFRLVGWLDENPACISESELKSWVSNGAIEFLGRLDDVRPALSDCSVYVLPSYREGTPRTVLEAMALGRPIITTDAPGCRETVKDGDNGFLVPVKEAKALAAAMEKFILQPELIERMGRRSREIAEEKYDVHKVNSVIMYHMGLSNETHF